MPTTISPFARTEFVLDEIASITGRHPELLRQWLRAGRLPGRQVTGAGRRPFWVMRGEDILSVLALRANVPTTKSRNRINAPAA